jgi:outer membrane immunogenic protein
MRRLSAFLLGAVAVAWAGGACAADLPAAGPPSYSPVYQPHIYDWTGAYFGAHIGSARRYDAYTDTTTTVLEPAGNLSSHAEWGTVGGVQIGVNYQFTPVVIGVEGTWSASSNTGYADKVSLVPSTIVRDTTTTRWFATATVRAGYAVDRLLLYVKGGGALVRSALERHVLVSTFGVDVTSLNDTRTGWTVGTGLEWGITENLSAKIEYDYLDFGTKGYTYNLPSTGIVTPVSVQSQTHMIIGGLNYRFTWGGGGSLVSAKY